MEDRLMATLTVVAFLHSQAMLEQLRAAPEMQDS